MRIRPTHCPAGHPYTPDNVYLHRSHGQVDGVQCKVCVKAAVRRHYYETIRGVPVPPPIVVGPRIDQIVAVLAQHPTGLTAAQISAKLGYRCRPVTVRALVSHHRRTNGVGIVALPAGRFRRYALTAA